MGWCQGNSLVQTGQFATMVVKDIWLHARSKPLWPITEDNWGISLGERPCACFQCIWFFAVGFEIQRKASGEMGLALMEFIRDAGMAYGVWTRQVEEH